MTKVSDIHIKNAELYLIEFAARTPLKFGAEVVKSSGSVRVRVTVEGGCGKSADGWGETPLSAAWAWPSPEGMEARFWDMVEYCKRLSALFAKYPASGHPLEIGADFQRDLLQSSLAEHNARPDRTVREPMPYLAALICLSPFDIALHDAYANLHQVGVYETYTAQWMNRDLSALLEPAKDSRVCFKGQYPAQYLLPRRKDALPAWHLVGGLDPLSEDDLTGQEPKDAYPHLLRDWIRRDGLKCLKIKLRGTDAQWDYERLVKIGEIAIAENVDWLTADFNCTVTDAQYVVDYLDRLLAEHPRIYGMLLYVEQPFPYELETHPIDVHAISARKPLFMDESAHDWEHVRMGRSLGWSGVALKTCKTQTGAVLSACWALAHGMPLMVQDLSNPMLAMIPHAQLAANFPTIMGIETNGCQFFPDASAPEAVVHPGLYRRSQGDIDLRTLGKTGFGYRIDEIKRTLSAPLA